MTVDTNVNTNDTDTELVPAVSAYPDLDQIIDTLAFEIRSLVTLAVDSADDSHAATLAGLRSLPDSLPIRTAIAAVEIEQRNASKGVAEATIAAIRAHIAPRLAGFLPAPASTTNGKRESAGVRAPSVSRPQSVMSADGTEYLKHVVKRDTFLSDHADSEACGRIGCRFSEIAASADTCKSGGAYRMNMTKAYPLMSDDEIVMHNECMLNAVVNGLEYFPAFETAIVYTRSR